MITTTIPTQRFLTAKQSTTASIGREAAIRTFSTRTGPNTGSNQDPLSQAPTHPQPTERGLQLSFPVRMMHIIFLPRISSETVERNNQSITMFVQLQRSMPMFEILNILTNHLEDKSSMSPSDLRNTESSNQTGMYLHHPQSIEKQQAMFAWCVDTQASHIMSEVLRLFTPNNLFTRQDLTGLLCLAPLNTAVTGEFSRDGDSLDHTNAEDRSNTSITLDQQLICTLCSYKIRSDAACRTCVVFP